MMRLDVHASFVLMLLMVVCFLAFGALPLQPWRVDKGDGP